MPEDGLPPGAADVQDAMAGDEEVVASHDDDLHDTQARGDSSLPAGSESADEDADNDVGDLSTH
jgi:hypothetical protein